MAHLNWSELSVFIVLFLLVTAIGSVAARWRPGNLQELNEWGLGGRSFGTVITWFLVGGDLYTAYTFIAVPALVFGKGAIGLFAIPYTIIVYPLIYVVMPKLWRIAHRYGYITASDYVRDRFDSRLLALLIAITGIVATIPYVALQMYGIEVVIGMMGVPVVVALIIAAIALAIFTFLSGLRAPALIALVKDTLIWIAVIVAVVYIPLKLGGYGAIFQKVPAKELVLPSKLSASYSSLAFGSALALFLYPHAVTGVFSSRSEHVVKRNAALLPAYTFLLGLIALLGYMAIAAGIKAHPPWGPSGAVPDLLAAVFPGPFAGFAYAAIAIGAIVPASVMSIAVGSLFTRNIYREFFRGSSVSARESTLISRVIALLVLAAAVAFILVAPNKFVINFQLAGGVWIVQTLPAVFMALYLRWLDRTAVILGWAAGIGIGTWLLVLEKFANSTHPLGFFGSATTWYIGVSALIANVVVVLAGSAVAAALRRGEREALTRPQVT